MRLVTFIFCAVLTPNISNAQLSPIINTGFTYLYTAPRFVELQLGGGVQFNDHLSFQLNFRHSKNIAVSPKESMKSEVLSFSLGYRLLDDDHIVSPLFIVDVGTPLSSNANNALMEHHFLIEDEYSLGMWKYNRGLVFGKMKLFLDVKIKSFNILLGGSYNLFVVSKYQLTTPFGSEVEYEIGKKYETYLYNFGAEAAFIYTFPDKQEKL